MLSLGRTPGVPPWGMTGEEAFYFYVLLAIGMILFLAFHLWIESSGSNDENKG